jgi:hypothetical protein
VRVIKNHLTIGLIYKDVWRLIPASVGTLVSLGYQLVNLYGFLPAIIITVFMAGIIAALLSLNLYLLSFFHLNFQLCVLIAAVIMVMFLLVWLLVNLYMNRRIKLRISKLSYSSRAALNILSLLLCNKIIPIKSAPRTQFWELHFKPTIAGQVQSLEAEELNAAIQADYKQLAAKLAPDTVLFGCTPGCLEKRMQMAGIKSTQFQIEKTIIPPEHAHVFGLKRSFFLHVLSFQPLLDEER